jgi:hypothetical protein
MGSMVQHFTAVALKALQALTACTIITGANVLQVLTPYNSSILRTGTVYHCIQTTKLSERFRKVFLQRHPKPSESCMVEILPGGSEI